MSGEMRELPSHAQLMKLDDMWLEAPYKYTRDKGIVCPEFELLAIAVGLDPDKAWSHNDNGDVGYLLAGIMWQDLRGLMQDD